MAEENVLRESVIEQSPSRTNDSSALSVDVVSQSDAGGKIVVVLVVELISLREISDGIVGIQLIEEVILFANHTEIIPTHAVVHG